MKVRKYEQDYELSPERRLNLAQDASPGYTMQHD